MDTDARPLAEDDLELIAVATDLVERRSDGHLHTVAAAVRDADGQIHAGLNLYHFTGGPCAELSALATARANGASALVTIVAVGDEGRGVLPPCGRDRQIFVDHHLDIRVIVPTDDGLVSVGAEQLLPFAYRRTGGR